MLQLGFMLMSVMHDARSRVYLSHVLVLLSHTRSRRKLIDKRDKKKKRNHKCTPGRQKKLQKQKRIREREKEPA